MDDGMNGLTGGFGFLDRFGVPFNDNPEGINEVFLRFGDTGDDFLLTSDPFDPGSFFLEVRGNWVRVVPEPSSVCLVAIGLGTLAIRRKR